MKLKDLKKGDFFTKKPIAEPNGSQVWIRGAYDPKQKKYECQCWDDANKYCCISGSKEVYTDFVF